MAEVLGIDVSHHNGKIDWSYVKKNGKKFAIIKAQYESKGHRVDEYFERNYKGAGENGLMRGVYIYIARTSVSDPLGDAKALLEKLNGRDLEYGIWLDLEDKNIRYLGKEGLEQLAYTYANVFRAAGYFVGIYCNLDWYNNLMSNNLKKDFDFWIARYPKNDTGNYNPNSSLKPKKIAVAWQFTSKANVPGCKTHVDVNVDFDGIINMMGTDKVGYRKTNREVAQEVIAGKWGTASTKPSRRELLTAAGYDYTTIQKLVNQLVRTK